MITEDRYINPKMEEELRMFKKKILYRHENGEIPKSFTFPRKAESSPFSDKKTSNLF